MGIRSRLLIMLALVLGIGGAALGFLLTRTTVTEFEFLVDQQREQNLPPLRDAATALEHAFAAGGWAAVAETLPGLVTADAGYLLLVMDQQQRHYGSNSDFQISAVKRGPKHVRVTLLNAGQGSRYVLMQELARTVPLQVGDQTFGRLLRLALPGRRFSQPQQQFLDQTRGTILGLGVLFLISALTIVFLLGRRITRPLQQLAMASKRISDGELGYQVPVQGSDEVGQLALRFNQMSTQLERTESLRKRMVSDVAHELRTPITGMRCNVEALRDGLIEYGPQTADDLYHDLLQLQRLVSDLQELSLAEAGELRYQVAATDLSQVLESAIRAVPFQDTAVRCRVEVMQPVTVVHTDGGRLRQILVNLLHNALAHSPPKAEVVVDLRQADGHSTIRIADQGEGVAESELANIFERFYRTDSARQRSAGGSGLGLAISRELITQMGGSIRALGNQPHGMIFEFTLPLSMPTDS